MFSKRQGIIVWLFSLKQAKLLRKYGNVHYVSKRLKYVVLYCDMSEVDHMCNKLNGLSFVKKVEVSHKPFLKIEFENSKPDEAKEYDYKLGL
ncbi:MULTISPECIES: YlbG family protein [Bacillaceae]|uniref:YlbG family protein n=1 Tax=Bacillaceae TaxID=186817 RepID=UPI001BDE03C0|nr:MULTISPECIES: YlbG family protein [Bacillaceae]MDX8359972.1 YlbG family protein [Cytobacillus sp. IB215316]MDX8364944.1 YlbG family protein [Cytobacillus sp. IB215665]